MKNFPDAPATGDKGNARPSSTRGRSIERGLLSYAHAPSCALVSGQPFVFGALLGGGGQAGGLIR